MGNSAGRRAMDYGCLRSDLLSLPVGRFDTRGTFRFASASGLHQTDFSANTVRRAPERNAARKRISEAGAGMAEMNGLELRQNCAAFLSRLASHSASDDEWA